MIRGAARSGGKPAPPVHWTARTYATVMSPVTARNTARTSDESPLSVTAPRATPSKKEWTERAITATKLAASDFPWA